MRYSLFASLTHRGERKQKEMQEIYTGGMIVKEH